MKILRVIPIVILCVFAIVSCQKPENSEMAELSAQSESLSKDKVVNTKSSYPISVTIDLTTSDDLYDVVENLDTDEKLIMEFDGTSLVSTIVGTVPSSFDHDNPNNPNISESCQLSIGGNPNYNCWNQLYEAAKYNEENGICFDSIWDTELNLGVVIERECV